MSDLFHADITDDYIIDVFNVMALAKQHTFQVLTKRSERLPEIAPRLPWPPNIWLGVSVEDRERVFRIHHLTQVHAAVRFLSVEPLLGPIPELPLDGIDWVIVGGESGKKARPMKARWAREIRDQCVANSVPFFLKQLGGRRGKRGGTEAVLDGSLWRETPVPAIA